MQISISRPDLERYVEEQVKTGQYPTPEALIETALEQLQSDQVSESSPEYEAYLRARLTEAEDDIKHDRVITMDEEGLRALCNDVKMRGRERLATKPNQP